MINILSWERIGRKKARSGGIIKSRGEKTDLPEDKSAWWLEVIEYGNPSTIWFVIGRCRDSSFKIDA